MSTDPNRYADGSIPHGSDPATPEPSDAEAGWTGADATSASLVRLPLDAPGSDADAAWKGEDATSVALTGARPADEEADWKGGDLTSVAPSPAPLPAAAEDSGKHWVGEDRTMPIGMASPAAVKPQGRTDESGTGTAARSGTGSRARVGTGMRTRATSVSFDDAWHMEGRKGPYTGQTWGDWELGGILGEGGMGAVYRAKQISLKRRVAIKVLAQNLAADTKFLHRFQLEARMTSMLSSPNLVQVFAAGEWQGLHFFAMEFVDGSDLYDVIKKRQAAKQGFTTSEASDFVLQAAKGLSEAGRYGMVHRDIKPSNLMVTKNGLVKVADFGIVKVLGESSLTMTGQAVGTPSYVSPEQGRGQLDIDQRADLYSLGVVFYELLCGKKPFEAITPNALIYQHCFAEPELPRTINPEISDEYQAVVLKCLQKKPENRYQSADELVKDLEALRTGTMLQSAMANYRSGTGAAEAQRENLNWAQRHLLHLVVGVAGALVLSGIGGLMYYTHYQDSSRLAGELFRELSALNNPQPIPRGAEKDLETYASLPGVDQVKIGLWREKLKKAAALTASLVRLDAEHVPNSVRPIAPVDLKLYQELVGVNEPQGVRWRNRLVQLQEQENQLREDLRVLDQKSDLTEAEYKSLAPELEDLSGMADADDHQIARYRQRLNDYQALQKSCRERLSVLDRGDGALTDERRLHLQGDLSTLELMLGKQDPDVQRWTARLVSSSDQVVKLRQSLKRLEQYDLPPLAVQRDMEKDLAAIKQLVDENDPDLRGWMARIAAAAAEVASLRTRLAAIDRSDLVQASQFQDYDSYLAALVKLTGESDGDAVRWSAKIRASRARIDDLQHSLTRLRQPESLTLEESRRLTSAVEQLDALGGISADERNAARRRIDDEASQFTQRRKRLSALDGAVSFTPALRQDLATYLAQISSLDKDGERWSEKRTAIDAALAHLAALDHAAPIPAGAEADLAKLETLVGIHDEDVSRWRAKIDRVAHLRKSLAALDAVRPLEATAPGDVAELERLIGSEDAAVVRWQGKIAQIGELKRALSELPITSAQSVEANHLAHDRCDRLRQLVGDSDADLQAWTRRLADLDGPGSPEWAQAYVRDQFGLFADVTVAGVPMRFRYVPPGSFLLGSPDDERGRDADEVQAPVTLTRGFWLAETECTQAAWAAVTGANPSRDQGRQRPVDRVSWKDCQQFLSQLSHLVGSGFIARLPREAEWEYACRAGGSGPFTGARSADSSAERLGWFDGNARGVSHEVKQRFPNRLGLYDIHGNVAEWCQDHYANYPTGASVDPLGVDGQAMVARGGSWGDPASSLRAANRMPARPDLRSAYLGLRIAVDAVTRDQGAKPTEIASTGATEPAPPVRVEAPAMPAPVVSTTIMGPPLAEPAPARASTAQPLVCAPGATVTQTPIVPMRPWQRAGARVPDLHPNTGIAIRHADDDPAPRDVDAPLLPRALPATPERRSPPPTASPIMGPAADDALGEPHVKP